MIWFSVFYWVYHATAVATCIFVIPNLKCATNYFFEDDKLSWSYDKLKKLCDNIFRRDRTAPGIFFFKQKICERKKSQAQKRARNRLQVKK
jgi:hypothetical protein